MIAALAVFATACSSAAVPVSSSPVPVTTAATTAAPTTVASSAPSVPSASDLLDGVVAALARTDTDSVLAVLAPDATFSLDGLDITLDRQLSADLAWLGAILELSPDATGLELLRAWLDLGWLMKARYVVGDCRTVGSAASCTFSRSDVETRITGQHVTGTLTIQSLGNLITRLEQFATTEGDVDPVFDTFMRWALIDQPDLGRELSAIRRAELLVGATDRWGAAGRPDVAAPDGIDGPVEVVHVIPRGTEQRRLGHSHGTALGRGLDATVWESGRVRGGVAAGATG